MPQVQCVTESDISMFLCSARFSKVLSNRSSFEGIWFLSIITYKFTLDTCFNLLRCQKVSGDNTKKFVSNLLFF